MEPWRLEKGIRSLGTQVSGSVGTEPGSSERAVVAHNHQASSLVLGTHLLQFKD